MALPFKPHTARVFAKGEPTTGSGTSVRGQLTPGTAAAVMNAFGVQLKRPHMWLCDAVDEPVFQEGGRLLMDGTEYTIEAKQVYKGIGAADHTQVLLNVFGAG